MLSFSLPGGFTDKTAYHYRLKDGDREYVIELQDGSAVTRFQSRRLLLNLEYVAEESLRAGHDVKLKREKGGDIVLRIKPVRRGPGKQKKPVNVVLRARAVCIKPEWALWVLTLGRKDDAREFERVVNSIRLASLEDTAKVRLEDADEAHGKWHPAGPVEIKLPGRYQFLPPLVRLNREGKLMTLARVTHEGTPRALTADWPLCDKVDYTSAIFIGRTYYEIDEGDPGLIEARDREAPTMQIEGKLRRVYSDFDSEETGRILVDIQKSMIVS